MEDRYGAFVADTDIDIAGADGGALSGSSFAAKDVFDVAGHRTGNGQPTWRATHEPAPAHAWAVRALLDAGAHLVGRTVCDELCYSLNGTNRHYGDPINPRSPERMTGGSSCGSAAAVAGGLADAALGSDCGGSVRVPASFCGLYGIRPSYGRVPTAGVAELASSFDVVGWFAREAELFAAIGRVLVPDWRSPAAPRRLMVADDLFAGLAEPAAAAARNLVPAVEAGLGLRATAVTLSPDGYEGWWQAFRVLQGAEIWARHGAWVRAHRPDLDAAIGARIEWASTITAREVAAMQKTRDAVASRLAAMLAGGVVLCLPTAGPPPLKSATPAALEEFRATAMTLTCTAGLAGVPQLHLPLGQCEGAPLGLSLMAAPGGDEMLIEAARRIGG